MNPCKTCPFIEASKNYGAPDWVEDVVFLALKGSTDHTCHCTDKNADGYIGGDKVRMCDGIKMLKINHDNGVRIHKKAYRNFNEFFAKQIEAWKLDGLLK